MSKYNISKRNDLHEFSSQSAVKKELIILHSITDRRADNPNDVDVIVNLLKEYKVSAHYLIARNGDIIELVSPKERAWHAGRGQYKGNTDLNSNSIGIELAGDYNEEFELEQYEALVELCTKLHFQFHISPMDIKGHQIVSDSSTRSDPKPDPGRYFDWIGFGYSLITNIIKDGG